MLACSCSIPDYEEYDFVALVHINKIKKTDSEFAYIIEFETLQAILGSEYDSCYVGSVHFQLHDLPGPCPISISEGEQWLLCGMFREGRLQTHYCSKTELHRRSNGELQYAQSGYNNQVSRLLAKFKPFIPNKINGHQYTYYDNGQIESEAFYKNGLIHGEDAFITKW